LFLAITFLSAGVGGTAAHIVYGWPVLDVIGLVAGGAAYPLVVRARHDRRRQLVRRALPEAIDRIRDGLGAGQTSDQAVSGLAVDGPDVVRPYFRTLKVDLSTGGDFALAVEHVRVRLADPTFDEVASALTLHGIVGGKRLSTCLGQRAAALRANLALRDKVA